MRGIIAEQLGVEEDKVVPGASFTDDLGPRGGPAAKKAEERFVEVFAVGRPGFPRRLPTR